jgi:hypothetical protein
MQPLLEGGRGQVEALPIVLGEAQDESLSSWLSRHAVFYGISDAALMKHCGLDARRLAGIDYDPNTQELRVIGRVTRRSAAQLRRMTHLQHLGHLTPMIACSGPVQICVTCQRQHRRDERSDVVMKSWSHGWRITCPVCSSRLQGRDANKVHAPADAFEHLQQEAKKGENLLGGISSLSPGDAAFIAALLHLLIMHRSRAFANSPRDRPRGRVLDVVVPGFDDIDLPAPFIVNPRSPLVVPIPIRIALLAGIWRAYDDPAMCNRIEDALSARKGGRLDIVKSKLLGDTVPEFSYLQQI